jgi:hypothetical protein
MERLKVLDQPLLDQPRPFRPEIAAVIDESSMLRVAAGGQVVTVPGVYQVRRSLGRCGAPYGQYLQDDLLAGRVPAKLIVMLTPWCLSPAQRQSLRTATRGRLKVWCYAPGYDQGAGVSLDAMRETTGFTLRRQEGFDAWAEPTDVGRQLGLTVGWGVKQRIQPLFAVADARPEETLAVWPDGSAAVAWRATDDGISLFVGPPGLTAPLVRLAARRAGVHLFTSTDCNVYANGPYLVLHASQAGPVELDTGRDAPVTDLLTGKPLGSGPRLTLPLEFGETRILQFDADPAVSP